MSTLKKIGDIDIKVFVYRNEKLDTMEFKWNTEIELNGAYRPSELEEIKIYFFTTFSNLLDRCVEDYLNKQRKNN